MPNDSYITTSMCPERLKLSGIVTKAIQANYAARDAHDRAMKIKKDVAFLAAVLADARKAESAAISALNNHRKEHGC